MNRHRRFLKARRILVTLGVVVTSRAGAQVHPASADAILSGLVWEAHIPVDSRLPTPIRAAIDAYNRRSAAYVPKVRPSPDRASAMFLGNYAPYERRLVAVSTDPRAVPLAREYVDSLKPPYEWEGYADGPEDEAMFADKYRAEHPTARSVTLSLC